MIKLWQAPDDNVANIYKIFDVKKGDILQMGAIS